MKIVLVSAIIFILSASSLSGGAERRIYTKFVRNLQNSYPNTYTCILLGRSIKKRLSKIPRSAVKKNRRPVVKVYFKKDIGQVIKVNYVDSVFRNMFSLYSTYLNLTGMYIIKKGRDWPTFQKHHRMKMIRTTSRSYHMKISRKNDSRFNYGLFEIDRRTLMINTVRFYTSGSLIYKVRNFYRRISGHFLPYRIKIIRMKSGIVRSIVNIFYTNYKINLPVSNSVFFD